jgi:hypothetical protein
MIDPVARLARAVERRAMRGSRLAGRMPMELSACAELTSASTRRADKQLVV